MTDFDLRIIALLPTIRETEAEPGVLIALQLRACTRGPDEEQVSPGTRLKHLRLRFRFLPGIFSSQSRVEGLVVGV
jgi:hypothetical protein